MWKVIPSLQPLMQALSVVFTEPSLRTHIEIFLGWIMCLGKRTEYAVFQTIRADRPVPRRQHHPFVRQYNFFSRSAWRVEQLAAAVARLVIRLVPFGKVSLIVDDTLLHKRGLKVYGLGWFRDPVASTAKRVATASGNHWVVLALAIPVPGTRIVLALTINARLHLPGEGQPGEADLAKEMLQEVLAWFPDRQFILLGDGAYAAQNLLMDLDERVEYVGRMRSDAEIYDPEPPPQPKGKRGPKPKKGPRLPSPREAVKKADRNRSGRGPWVWRTIQATAYGVTRSLQVLEYRAVWPRVLGLRPIRIVVVRDPQGKCDDVYLFTTDLNASLEWVVITYSRRWSIEVLFKSSKQVMQIEAPQHRCQQSVEKLAPWVWLMQSLVTLWYLSAGRHLPEAAESRDLMGPWDQEYSLRNMLRVLRRAILRQTIKAKSDGPSDMAQLVDDLENYLSLAT